MPVELTQNENMIYDIVLEYLNQNRVFQIENLLSFIKARFRAASININEQGIETLLKGLVEKNLLVEGSKMTKEQVLENAKRNLIYKYILEHPGIHINRLIRKTGLPFNVVIWHVNILETFGFVNRNKIENRCIFHSPELELNKVKFYYFTTKDQCKKIFNYLKAHDYGITKTALSSDLNMHIDTVSKYLEFLGEYNIVSKKIESNKTLFFLEKLSLELKL